MALIAALLAQAVATQPPAALAKLEWLARPTAMRFAQCAEDSRWQDRPADVKLRCLTGPDGRLVQCVVISTSVPADRHAEDAARCVASDFKVRALGADGKPLLGAPVGVPIHFGPTAPQRVR